ncbi:MAG: sigma factor-like helix-turn-helix DNA-binding protein [Patescibacteria group bacterium]|nr:sigma factor-like helix-turn-helix DNA-binding protein [Patescibacteria group bacterium]
MKQEYADRDHFRSCQNTMRAELEIEDPKPAIMKSAMPDAIDASDIQMDSFYDGLSDYSHGIKEPTIDPAANGNESVDEHALITSSLRYVRYRIVKDIGRPNHRLQIMDRVQNCNLVLIKAAKKYDHSTGASFISFHNKFLIRNAQRVERGAESGINQGEMIRIPLHRTNFYKVRDMLEALSFKFGRPMEPEELLQFSNLDFENSAVEEYKAHATTHIPFDRVFNDKTPHDLTADEPTDPHSVFEASLPNNGVSTALSLLSKREAYVLSARLGLDGEIPATLESVGLTLDLTKERIRQIENIALTKLRAVDNIREIIEMYIIEPVYSSKIPYNNGEV